jgi:hypothetical protein
VLTDIYVYDLDKLLGQKLYGMCPCGGKTSNDNNKTKTQQT